ncbi:MAG: hypothetical protein K2N68_03565 [Clostridia bacterium]|nr:hypothetical protein [Clostridia bacterium]MDE7214894.1 hypothetical protein [Clostridia bacterium]
MKVYKAIIFFVFAVFLWLAQTAVPVFAAENPQNYGYAYADVNSSVYIYGAKDFSKKLFIIPQTYCVEILAEEDGWLRVKYADDTGIYRAVYGYCRAGELVKTEAPLKNPFLQRTVTVIYRTDSPSGFLPSLGDIEMTAAYYGAYEVGSSTYSYVLCGSSFGYIDWQIGDYELNELPSAPTFTPTDGGGTDAKVIVAVVIAAVAVAAIGGLYFATRKRTPPQKRDLQ